MASRNPRRLPYRLPFQAYPEELKEMRVECKTCKTQIPISWTSPQESPKIPLVPDDGGGHWVPISFTQTCQACGQKNVVSVPTRKGKSRGTLYGDEAFRDITHPHPSIARGPLFFYCISLVYVASDKVSDLQEKFNEVKRSVRSKRDPNSWVFHTKDFWQSKAGESSFDVSTKLHKIAKMEEIAELISEFKPALFTMNSSRCIFCPADKKDRRAAIKVVRESVFAQSILLSLHLFRNNNIAPSWVFDSLKDTSRRVQDEGWAKEIFLGFQYQPIFTWLSAGATIHPPEFIT